MSADFHHNRNTSTSCVINKLFEYLINKKFVDHFNKNSFQSDQQYVFHFSRTTADVLMVIIHRLNEAQDNIFIIRVVTLDISIYIDNEWNRKL